ncbi:hypothetical protein GQ57_29990 [Burkholderia sp. MSh2]|nr:hypothetical protein GQ57_29990 [Burkholderia sp. MSh2]KFG92664.1 hypothetical protein GQ56_0136105 [Burkholderia paludis]
MPVVVQARILINLLPLEPQRTPRHDPRNLRHPRNHLPRFAPRPVRRLPHHIAFIIRQQLRRTDLVAVVIERMRITNPFRQPLQRIVFRYITIGRTA